jgi:hypothetical protein
VNVLAMIFVGGGGGVLVAAVITAISTFSPNRASAAKLLSEAAATIAEEDRLLRKDLEVLRKAIIALTDAVDEVIPLLDVDNAQRAQLRKANTAAKLAV